MRKLVLALLAICILLLAVTAVSAKKSECTTIQSGDVVYSPGHYLAGESLTTGFDDWGYNYQGHMFKGLYTNSYLGGAGFAAYTGDDAAYLPENSGAELHWAWPYRDVQLMMKWNDAWISNQDCDGDGALDRHYGVDSYIGSSAWLTNHQWGEYELDGKTCKWNYFVKIVAAPADAEKVEGIWFAADDTELGPDIWGQFIVIQEVENDLCAGAHGLLFNADGPTGFGWY